jgi:hypothetical protein
LSRALQEAQDDTSPRAARPKPDQAKTLLKPELANETSPLPVSEVNRLFTQRGGQEQAPPARSSQSIQQTKGGALHGDVARVHVDGIEFTSLATQETFAPVNPAGKPHGPAPIDERKWVAGIPRSCDTCRDFQRDADGKTGRCGNSYAFSRPTVVECDQLACRSSVSVWWLPSDDFWLDRAEIAHHTRPTPYLDAVLSELRPGSR